MEVCRVPAALRRAIPGGVGILQAFYRLGRATMDAMLYSFQSRLIFPSWQAGPFRPRKAMKEVRFSTLDVAGSRKHHRITHRPLVRKPNDFLRTKLRTREQNTLGHRRKPSNKIDLNH
jgi:hypothetical protein